MFQTKNRKLYGKKGGEKLEARRWKVEGRGLLVLMVHGLGKLPVVRGSGDELLVVGSFVPLARGQSNQQPVWPFTSPLVFPLSLPMKTNNYLTNNLPGRPLFTGSPRQPMAHENQQPEGRQPRQTN